MPCILRAMSLPLSDTARTVRMHVTIPEDLLDRWKDHCDRNGVKMAARMRAMIERELDKAEAKQ